MDGDKLGPKKFTAHVFLGEKQVRTYGDVWKPKISYSGDQAKITISTANGKTAEFLGPRKLISVEVTPSPK